MAEGGSSPVGDPGSLHMYTMNGGTHKLAELVAGGNMGGVDGILNVNDLGMYPGISHNAQYPMENSIPTQSYLHVEPLGYNENSSFEEMKRLQHAPSPFYNNMENVQTSNNVYDANVSGFQPAHEMYKNTDSMGYVHMLNNSDALGANMNIKKEKLDYSESIGLINSQTLDIPFPPNTCIADWNYYNSTNVSNASANATQSNFVGFGFQHGQQQQHPVGHQAYNSNQMPPMSLGLNSNIDIHNQSREITQQILSTEWSSETLYKSQLYSTVAGDTSNINSKKRRSESERPSRAKSRKKKSMELGGHSKTVASILLSETASSEFRNRENSARHNDGNLLDSSARNSLVTSLMDNLRSTVQFESFCLSFPRSRKKETAFCHKVIATSNMINTLGNKTITSKPFPSTYVQGATKVISTFKKALDNSKTAIKELHQGNTKHENISERNLSSDQVEQHLSHSMVWAVKVGDNMLTANWEGQFVVTVNPIQHTLCFSVFQFQPKFSSEGLKCLHQAKLSNDLANDIIENMEQFEVSRQLRFDVNLNKVVQLYLHTPLGNHNEGCLILEVTEKPLYFQRWLHTSAEEKNKWQQRKSIFPNSKTRSSEFVYIGGLMSELNELVALILAGSHDLEVVYEIGIEKAMRFESKDMNIQNGFDEFMNDFEHIRKSPSKSQNFKHCRTKDIQCNELREELLTVLVNHRIIENKGQNNVTLPEYDGEKERCSTSLEIKLDAALSSCFRDYVNFSCDSAIELSKLLDVKVSPRLHGFCESDFDMSQVPGGNIDELTVGQLISSRCSEVVYFSFCSKEVGQLGHEQHCSQCRHCNTWRYWHCDTCNTCSESGPVCEYCGHLRSDQTRIVIKPLSVFKSQVSSGTLNLDTVKDEWASSLTFSDDDFVFWELPNASIENEDKNNLEDYNSSNAMVDQLGLLNPVGFLLGQISSGATRKHRRYKGTQPLFKMSDSPPNGSQAGSGCSVQ